MNATIKILLVFATDCPRRSKRFKNQDRNSSKMLNSEMVVPILPTRATQNWRAPSHQSRQTVKIEMALSVSWLSARNPGMLPSETWQKSDPACSRIRKLALYSGSSCNCRPIAEPESAPKSRSCFLMFKISRKKRSEVAMMGILMHTARQTIGVVRWDPDLGLVNLLIL